MPADHCPQCGADLASIPPDRRTDCPVCRSDLDDAPTEAPDSTGRRPTTDSDDFPGAATTRQTPTGAIGYYIGAYDHEVAPADHDVELLVETPGGDRVSFGYDADTWAGMADAVQAADGYLACIVAAMVGCPTVGIVDGDRPELAICPNCGKDLTAVDLVRVSE